MKVHPAVPEESPKAIQGTRAASATKRSIDEVEEPQEQRTPTPRYFSIVARAAIAYAFYPAYPTFSRRVARLLSPRHTTRKH
ncbi:hypothetical protein E4U23_008225 [Claviceps purpurea]|nr:hypothetical protein E4U23_008225 [Claviceps purpurea]